MDDDKSGSSDDVDDQRQERVINEGASDYDEVESDYDQERIVVFERVPRTSKHPGFGWRLEITDNDEDYQRWERVIKNGANYQIVECIACEPGDPVPSGRGWKRPTQSSGEWYQREIRDPQKVAFREELGDVSNDFDDARMPPPPVARRGWRVHGGSSVAHPRSGNSLRAFVTVSLTSSIIIVVLIGVILQLPIESFAAYISPLLTLAGTALGYWFGSERKD